MSFGGTEVGSIKATVGLNTDDLKRGLDQAKQALSESARMTQDALRFTNDLAKGIDREADATRRSNVLRQQSAALDRELTAAKARLGEVLAGESRLIQDISARYPGLSNARRAELVEVRQQIAAQEQLAIAANKAAAAQIAAQRNLGRNLQTVGRGLTNAVTTPIVGAALAAGYAGEQVQNAEAGLRAGTGLTGNALAGVEESFKRIAPQVSQPLKVVADAVGELERRTGETGPALEKLAVAELNLQRVTGSGNELFKQSAQVFAAWNVPVERQVPLLNELLRAHQLTGISVNTLLASVSKSAPTFQLMGKSVEDSIATFSAFNKVNILPERLITALNTAMGKLAKAGVPDVGKALSDMLQRIQNLKDPTEALSEAVRLFGARGGTQLANELRKGTLSIEQLESSIKSGSDTISKAAKDTEAFSVVWGQMRNAVEIALAPLGKVILQFVILAAQALKPAVEWLEKVLEAFGKLSPGMQEFILGSVAVVAALGPIIAGIGSLITTFGALRTAWVGITVAFGATEALAAIPLLLNPITLALGALAGAAALVALNWDTLSSSFKTGIGVLERLPGNLAAGYGISSSLNRSMQDAAAANQGPNANVSGMGFTVPQPQFSGPEDYQRSLKPATGIPGLTGAEHQALFGKDKKPKLSEAQKEDQRATEQMLKDARELSMLQRGESVDVARLASQYPHLSAARLEEVVASRRQLDEAVKATESRKAYSKDIDILNASIRRLKQGHDAEASGVDALREKYPGLSNAMLQAMNNAIQWKKHLVDVREEAHKVAEAIRGMQVNILESGAEGRLAETAARLFGPKVLEKAGLNGPRPKSADDLLKNYLTPEQQAEAVKVAGTGAYEALDAQVKEQRRNLFQNYGELKTGGIGLKDRAGQALSSAIGENAGEYLSNSQLTVLAGKARELIQLKDAATQAAAAQSVYDAEWGKFNTVVGTAGVNFEILQKQFAGLTSRSALTREVMQQFGVSLRDLPKATQDALRASSELARGLKFVQDFASGVEGVFQNMFSNLFQHGFKGFFSSVTQGFNQMLQKMAADYLSSQLSNVFMNLLGPLLGSAFGGGAGVGGAGDIASAGLSGGAAAALSMPVPTFAGGGSYSGGPMLVGEHGAELMFPKSAGTIMPHAQSMAMMGGHHTTNNITMNISTQDAASFQAPQNRHAITESLARELQRAQARRR